MIDSGDKDAIQRERIVSKLIRVDATAQDGFIMENFPKNVKDAESLEEVQGGINSFVHISMPERFLAKLEEVKYQCKDCNATYYEEAHDHELGVSQSKTLPDDGFCVSCGSHHIKRATNPEKFERKLKHYHQQKSELLSFYDHHGLLVDIDLKKGGIEDYENVRQQIQYNIKF